ncbi:MAG: hypothetical protein KatS3mg087_1312 [Patescibacteria group bacterium]|nr:MAG: hypothetical protein KatS3mg087_1312 [Patescibacteria group bacterium]
MHYYSDGVTPIPEEKLREYIAQGRLFKGVNDKTILMSEEEEAQWKAECEREKIKCLSDHIYNLKERLADLKIRRDVYYKLMSENGIDYTIQIIDITKEIDNLITTIQQKEAEFKTLNDAKT